MVFYIESVAMLSLMVGYYQMYGCQIPGTTVSSIVFAAIHVFAVILTNHLSVAIGEI